MTQVIVVTSGKGGVGKTTTSASIAAGLAKKGHKTAVLDFDVGLRNLDLILGCERRVVYDFVNVINGEATLQQALIKDKRLEKLYILPASQTRDKDALSQEGVEKIINELKKMEFEYIICDSPAGIEKGAQLAMYFADDAIITTNPEVSSVRDSDRILGILSSKTAKAEKGEEVRQLLVVNRYNPDRAANGDMLSVDDVLEILGISLLGVVPESEAVLQCSNAGTPVILDEESDAGQAYDDIVARYLGEERPQRFIEKVKKGFLKKLLEVNMLSGLFRKRKNKASASIAKERLQIIVAHERKQFGSSSTEPDFLQAMQRDILKVVSKYMKIDNEQIKIAMDKEDGCDVLELNIVLLDKDEVQK